MNNLTINQKNNSLPITCAAMTDVGKARMENEDAYVLQPEIGLFLIADGLGGHQAGGIAAGMIASILPNQIHKELSKDCKGTQWLQHKIMEMNRIIYEESKNDKSLTGMGSTLVMAWTQKERVTIAHVGDSRAYLFSEDKLTQLTQDHSILFHLLKKEIITPKAAKHHPLKNQITQYLGMAKDIVPDITSFTPQHDDRILLCSDGLTDMVCEEEIAEILKDIPDPQMTCKELITRGIINGGEDNITVIVVDWVAK